MFQEAQAKLDAAIAAGAVTAPWWLWYFDHISHVALVVGGLVLLFFRILIAVREWRRKG